MSCCVLIIDKNNWSLAFHIRCWALCRSKLTRSSHWTTMCLLGFSKCLPVAAPQKEAAAMSGQSAQRFSVNAPLMICLKTFNIIIILIKMENWILYRCIKKYNFPVTWITLQIIALALWKKSTLLYCFVSLWTSCYLTILRLEIIEENLTKGYALKGRWNSLLPHIPLQFSPYPLHWTLLSGLGS